MLDIRCVGGRCSHLPPVTVSSANALNLQLPTWLSIHCTCPWWISSKMAVSCVNVRVVNFLRRLLCIVRKRPVQAYRRRGCSNLSSAINASNSGRSKSVRRLRWVCDAAAKSGHTKFPYPKKTVREVERGRDRERGRKGEKKKEQQFNLILCPIECAKWQWEVVEWVTCAWAQLDVRNLY